MYIRVIAMHYLAARKTGIAWILRRIVRISPTCTQQCLRKTLSQYCFPNMLGAGKKIGMPYPLCHKRKAQRMHSMLVPYNIPIVQC
jgi:hypothetical protein